MPFLLRLPSQERNWCVKKGLVTSYGPSHYEILFICLLLLPARFEFSLRRPVLRHLQILGLTYPLLCETKIHIHLKQHVEL